MSYKTKKGILQMKDSIYANGKLLDDVFEAFGSLESRKLRLRNLDGFLGLRIDSSACSSCLYFELAEACDICTAAVLQSVRDRVEYKINDLRCFLLGEIMLFCNYFSDALLVKCLHCD